MEVPEHVAVLLQHILLESAQGVVAARQHVPGEQRLRRQLLRLRVKGTVSREYIYVTIEGHYLSDWIKSAIVRYMSFQKI